MGYIELEFNQQGMTKELFYNSCHYNEKELAWILTYKPQKFTRRVILLKLNENDYKNVQSIVNYMETFHLKICGDYSPWTAATHPSYPLNNCAKSKDPSSTLEEFEIEPTPHNEGILIQTPTIEVLSNGTSLPADIKMYDIDEKGEKTLYARFFSDQSKAEEPVTDPYNLEDEFFELDTLYNEKSRLETSNSDSSKQRAMITTYLSQNNIKESIFTLTMAKKRILVNHESSISLKIFMGGESLANIKDIATKYQDFLAEVTGEYYQENHLGRSEIYQEEDFIESQNYVVINEPEIKFINGTPKIDPYENELLLIRISLNFDQNTFSRLDFDEMYSHKILKRDVTPFKYNFYLDDKQWETLKNIIYNRNEWKFVLEGSFAMKIKDRLEFNAIAPQSAQHQEELIKKYGSMEEYYRLNSYEKSYTINVKTIHITEEIRSENNKIPHTTQMIH